ncbi:anthranilate synthase component I [Alkaliphilus metalliredigens]|nr:anthranilate synthase component I [Alkaliphilus metalliredigens]
MIYPNLKTFEKVSKGYNMSTIYEEIQGDMETPITLFKKLCKESNCYLLESVERSEKKGRYSYVGRDPFMTIKGHGDEVEIFQNNKISTEKGIPLEIVKSIMKAYKTPFMDGMPDFSGGAVGFIGYDTIRNYELLPNVNEEDIKIPEIHLLLTKEVIVYDHLKHKIIILVNIVLEGDNSKSYEAGVKRLKEIKKQIFQTPIPEEVFSKNAKEKIKYSSNETKESFMGKVLRAKEYIQNGDIFQVVLSQRLQVEVKTSPFQIYRNLRSISPSPYMFYINFEEYQVVGASPELLVKVKGSKVETCPIAGTRPRGKTSQEDERLAKELLEDEKERAEHLMLVDLARNDIGKIANFGTVELKEYMEVYYYSHVMHIVSIVTGSLQEKKDMYDALISCLPAGTLSGAPKIRAMEIIDELENKKRGIYGGAVGYFGFDGNMDMCIAIRTLLIKDRIAYLQAGAGIVADSNPEAEYKETLRKLDALVETIKIA